ncbi:MAG: alpha/beta hydrolase [Porcincola intestinalis]|uniref:alpha/beta hydrolase n=1 Tax=Porcincola intestinalis TaxID=2606632 RepID=UPI0029DBEC98|nr:alpha/beta hydrolase [Porcincola intestinalis]MCI6238767.1 alpha/beta hydrolase [Lachnospiraceae bacterium]MDY5332737.1 alpha/beta hydrolase [Porcincola intestinalis]MDY5578587.1 alpha/beta hydrolase [Porcincola intestinalis]
MSEVSERLRVEWAKGDQARDAGLTTPAYIRRYNDIPYGDDRDWNALDVYRNRYKAGKLPVIMLIHGGGWVYGCKELYQYYGMELARRGFAVVNYSYRLAPEHPFPAQLQDTVAVAAWIMKHADEYGFDTNNVFAVGDSAGAHITGLFCAFLTDEGYRNQFAFQKPEGFRLRGVGMNCGVYGFEDHENDDEWVERNVLLGDLLSHPESPACREQIDVLHLVNRNFPPAYIMTCEGDFLKEQAPFLHSAYEKAGARSELHIFGSPEHPLYHVFHVTVQEAEGQKCNDEECAFFQGLIGRD